MQVHVSDRSSCVALSISKDDELCASSPVSQLTERIITKKKTPGKYPESEQIKWLTIQWAGMPKENIE